jgi:hypothetical protein
MKAGEKLRKRATLIRTPEKDIRAKRSNCQTVLELAIDLNREVVGQRSISKNPTGLKKRYILPVLPNDPFSN